MSQPGSIQWEREDQVLHQMNVHVDHVVDLTRRLQYRMETAYLNDNVAGVEDALLQLGSEVMAALGQVKEWNVMHEGTL